MPPFYHIKYVSLFEVPFGIFSKWPLLENILFIFSSVIIWRFSSITLRCLFSIISFLVPPQTSLWGLFRLWWNGKLDYVRFKFSILLNPLPLHCFSTLVFSREKTTIAWKEFSNWLKKLVGLKLSFISESRKDLYTIYLMVVLMDFCHIFIFQHETGTFQTLQNQPQKLVLRWWQGLGSVC